MGARLPRAFFLRDPETVAKALLGQRLVRTLNRKRVAGRIIEVEAYLGERDAAAHTYRGRRTPRNEAMYAIGGTAYVYFIYGLHHCVNVVTQDVNEPTAVLIRALEPVEGLDVMQRNRGRKDAVCDGPAKLCQALAIDRRLNGIDLTQSEQLWIERDEPISTFKRTPRIGVDYAGAWAKKPLRFFASPPPR